MSRPGVAPDRRCWYHRYGVPPEAKPFYKPGCDRCEQKLADGKVSASDPPPAAFGRRQLNEQTRARQKRARAGRTA